MLQAPIAVAVQLRPSNTSWLLNELTVKYNMEVGID